MRRYIDNIYECQMLRLSDLFHGMRGRDAVSFRDSLVNIGLPAHVCGFTIDEAERLLETGRNSGSAQVRASSNALNTDEAASIFTYTIPNGPSETLNDLLRGDQWDRLRDYVQYMWLLMSGLRKCPRPTSTTIYRGIRGDVSWQYIVGGEVTWKAFSSCSGIVGTLENDAFMGKSGSRTKFDISCTTNRARSIKHMSFIEDEEEILLPPNTKLRVISKLDCGHGLHVVQLEEEKCEDPILEFSDDIVGQYPAGDSILPITLLHYISSIHAFSSMNMIPVYYLLFV